MRATHFVLLEVLRARLWVIPSLAALLAAFAALLSLWMDQATDSLGLGLPIGADSARALLSTISGAMISFTALVFSITMLVLQAASTQLSPRVIRTFLRDRFNQVVLGLFVATFVFALLVLAAVGDDDVPQLSVISTIGLVLVAVLAFAAYIDHMAHDIRPTSVITSIAAEARAVIEDLYPDAAAEAPRTSPQPADDESEDTTVTWSGSAGYVQSLDRERLLAFVEEQRADVVLRVGAGGFLVHGQPLLVVRKPGDATSAAEAGLESMVRVGPERTMSEDPEFGLRLLVDVALRALSPSLNDPSTANQAIDRLHELLALLRGREITSPLVLTAGQGARAHLPTPDWDDYVRLATSEIGLACRTVPQVRRHLREMIESLQRDAAAPRQPALRRAQAELESAPTTEAAR
jgi:uncharacterized membrane protein